MTRISITAILLALLAAPACSDDDTSNGPAQDSGPAAPDLEPDAMAPRTLKVTSGKTTLKILTSPLTLTLPENTSGHAIEVADELFIFLFRELRGFTDKHIVVGTYFRNDEVNQELRRLELAVAASLFAVLIVR